MSDTNDLLKELRAERRRVAEQRRALLNEATQAPTPEDQDLAETALEAFDESLRQDAIAADAERHGTLDPVAQKMLADQQQVEPPYLPSANTEAPTRQPFTNSKGQARLGAGKVRELAENKLQAWLKNHDTRQADLTPLEAQKLRLDMQKAAVEDLVNAQSSVLPIERGLITVADSVRQREEADDPGQVQMALAHTPGFVATYRTYQALSGQDIPEDAAWFSLSEKESGELAAPWVLGMQRGIYAQPGTDDVTFKREAALGNALTSAVDVMAPVLTGVVEYGSPEHEQMVQSGQGLAAAWSEPSGWYQTMRDSVQDATGVDLMGYNMKYNPLLVGVGTALEGAGAVLDQPIVKRATELGTVGARDAYDAVGDLVPGEPMENIDRSIATAARGILGESNVPDEFASEGLVGELPAAEDVRDVLWSPDSEVFADVFDEEKAKRRIDAAFWIPVLMLDPTDPISAATLGGGKVTKTLWQGTKKQAAFLQNAAVDASLRAAKDASDLPVTDRIDLITQSPVVGPSAGQVVDAMHAKAMLEEGLSGGLLARDFQKAANVADDANVQVRALEELEAQGTLENARRGLTKLREQRAQVTEATRVAREGVKEAEEAVARLAADMAPEEVALAKKADRKVLEKDLAKKKELFKRTKEAGDVLPGLENAARKAERQLAFKKATEAREAQVKRLNDAVDEFRRLATDSADAPLPKITGAREGLASKLKKDLKRPDATTPDGKGRERSNAKRRAVTAAEKIEELEAELDFMRRTFPAAELDEVMGLSAAEVKARVNGVAEQFRKTATSKTTADIALKGVAIRDLASLYRQILYTIKTEALAVARKAAKDARTKEAATKTAQEKRGKAGTNRIDRVKQQLQAAKQNIEKKARVRTAEDAARRSAEIFDQVLDAMIEQNENFKKAMARGEAAMHTFDPAKSLASQAIQSMDAATGAVTLAADKVSDLRQFADTSAAVKLAEAEKAGLPAALTKDEYQSLFNAEQRAFQRGEEARTAAFRGGQLVADTVAQRKGLTSAAAYQGVGAVVDAFSDPALSWTDRFSSAGSGAALAFATVADRAVRNLEFVFNPIASNGWGNAPEIVQGAARKFSENYRVGQVELGEAYELAGSDWAVVEKLLRTKEKVQVRAGVASLNQGHELTPMQRAIRGLARLGRADDEVFASLTPVQGLVYAGAPSGKAASKAADSAMARLRDAVRRNPAMTEEEFDKAIRGSWAAFTDEFRGAGAGADKAELFRARAIAALANVDDLLTDLHDIGLSRTPSPADGSLAQAVEYITTQVGKLPSEAIDDTLLQAQAIDEALTLMQRYKTGVGDQVQAGTEQLAAGGVAFLLPTIAKKTNEMVRLGQAMGDDIYVPMHYIEAVNGVTERLAKELVQYGESGAASTIKSVLRLGRSAAVFGLGVPRLAMYGTTALGDVAQTATMIGFQEAARLGLVSALNLVPDPTRPLSGMSLGGRIQDFINKGAKSDNIASRLTDADLSAIMHARDDYFIKTVEGPKSAAEVRRLGEANGALDSLPTNDLYRQEALKAEQAAGSSRVRQWANTASRWALGQNPVTESFAKLLETEQHRKRMSLFNKLLKDGYTPAESGRIMRETFIDWTGGLAKWERQGLYELWAFHSYHKGALAQIQKAVLRDLAGIEQGRVLDYVYGRTARMVKQERLGEIPAMSMDASAEAMLGDLDDDEQRELYELALRPEYRVGQYLMESKLLDDGAATVLEDARGKKYTHAQLYLAETTANWQLGWLNWGFNNAAWAAHLPFEDLDDNIVMADRARMTEHILAPFVDMVGSDPLAGDIVAGSVDAVAGTTFASKFKQSRESMDVNGERISGNEAMFLYYSGFGGLVGVRKDENGRPVYTTDPTVAQTGARLAMRLPTALSGIVRAAGEYGRPELVEAVAGQTYDSYMEWFNALGEQAPIVFGVQKQNYTNPSEQTDFEAMRQQAELKKALRAAEKQAFPGRFGQE